MLAQIKPLTTMAEPASSPPLHLSSFVIRALRASEAEACEAFCSGLDWRDIYMRFGSRRFSIAHFLPDRDPPTTRMSLAAIDAAEMIVGILNLVYISPSSAEIALIVRSDCKRQGIGRALVARAIDWATAHHVSLLVGHVNAENKAVLSLARTMRFESIKWDSFSVEVRRLLPGGRG